MEIKLEQQARGTRILMGETASRRRLHLGHIDPDGIRGGL
jgi:hypothetical protein